MNAREHEDDSTQEAGYGSGFLFELIREREERIRKALTGPHTKVKNIRFYGSKSIKDEWHKGEENEPCNVPHGEERKA